MVEMAMGLTRSTYRYKNGRTADLFVPSSWAHKRMREVAERQGAEASTREGLMGRTVDNPVRGKVVAMPRDERDARYQKPLFYADMGDVRNGETPLLIMGMGARHVEELKDMADEARHYGEDVPQRPPEDRPPNLTDFYHEAVEWRRKQQRGAKTYGAMAKRI